MILHLGGVFGDKAATFDRFCTNYKKLSPGIKKILVLENDDVSWSVHDLLPVCGELDIPMVLDYHHHNIIFDADRIREGRRISWTYIQEFLPLGRERILLPKCTTPNLPRPPSQDGSAGNIVVGLPLYLRAHLLWTS